MARVPIRKRCVLALILAVTACGGDTFTYSDAGGDLLSAPTPVGPALVYVDEDGTAEITLAGVDRLGAPAAMTVEVTAKPQLGKLDVTTGPAPLTVTFTPDPDVNGFDALTFTVTDEHANVSYAARVNLEIVPRNDAPTAVADAGVATDEDTPVAFDPTANDTDPDFDALVISSLTQPAHGLAAISGDIQITYAPDANYAGQDAFTYTVRDPAGASSTAVVTVTVSARNDAPTTIAGAFTTLEDTPHAGTLGGADVDGPQAIYSIVAGATQGTALITDATTGAFTYIPAPNANGGDSFSFKRSDGELDSNVSTVAVVITPVNDAPSAVADTGYGTDSRTSLSIDVTANDTDPEGDPLEVVGVTAPSPGGSAVINPDRTITFVPSYPLAGAVTFNYTVRDAAQATSEATVTVNVTLAEPPVAITSFYAAHPYLVLGSGSELTWTSRDATSCTIDPVVAPGAAVFGVVYLQPLVTTTYTLSCDGPGGPVTAQETIVVALDSDQDLLSDPLEFFAGTSLADADSDDDGIPDGVEDRNQNGLVDPGETDPRAPDSMGGGFCDHVRTDNDGDGLTPPSACRDPEVVAAGYNHTCVVSISGEVRCWGTNEYGELGLGNMTPVGDDELPSSVAPVQLGGTAVQIAAGWGQTCALLTTGDVRCWGLGWRLGYGNANSIGDDEPPASVGAVSVGGKVVQIGSGDDHFCALLSTGSVRCWGNGGNGRLGYGNTNIVGDDELPSSAGPVSLGEVAVKLTLGGAHTCALLVVGAVRCWGSGADGRLGYGNTNAIGDNELPSSVGVVNVGGTVVDVAAGGGHTCVMLDGGAVRCWGLASTGQLGYGNMNTIGDNELPSSVPVVNVGGPVAQMSLGDSHTCARLTDGAARCWGWGSYGQLGYGNMNSIGDNEVPASSLPIDVGGLVAQLSAGSYHTCTLLTSGQLRCFGWAGLGLGNTNYVGDNEMPLSVPPVDAGGGVGQLVAGDSHTCVLLSTGHVRCWGQGSSGQLGYGNAVTVGDNEPPASLPPLKLGLGVTQLAAGGDHTCAVLTSGNVRCWGDNAAGQLGYGNTNNIGDDELPESVAALSLGVAVTQVAAGENHTCALLETGAAYCWGEGAYGQLGYADTTSIGDNESALSAGPINLVDVVTQISAGARHTCALVSSGQIRCWGDNASGQLGYGNTSRIGDDELPAIAGTVAVGEPAVYVSAGAYHTCALLTSGTVRCWGDNTWGQLGYGNTDNIGDDELPLSVGTVNTGSGTVVQLETGAYHTCVLLSTGPVRCWGRGDFGRLGYGNTDTVGDDEVPVSLGTVMVNGAVRSIAAGARHNCALLTTGKLRCWGDNANGQLGYGNTTVIGDDEFPFLAGDMSVKP